MTRAPGEPVLRLAGITKRFGDTLANDDVTVELARGEVLALLGENGAGKTTLMNILFGHYAADEGAVVVEGRTLPAGRPGAAIAAGVGMVHQHFALAANLSVLDNVIAGREPLFAPFTRRRAARRRLAALGKRFGLAVDPDARVASLSVGERQRVEILKALYNEARILILDEPTAVLTGPEAERLFDTLRAMAADGLSVIFISHKLEEVMRAADRILVLRAGRLVAERRPSQTSRDELAELMVGRRVARPRRTAPRLGDPVLSARGIHARFGTRSLAGADLTVRAGETLGIVGVAGNGQSVLAALASGLLAPSAGRLEIAGAPVTHATRPRELAARGVCRIPEDRQAEGAVADLPVWENVALERLSAAERRGGAGLLRAPRWRAAADDIITRYDVRGAKAVSRTGNLSGGNLQKLILGRTLGERARLVVAVQPTRGLDEGAIAQVQAALLAARDAGAGILLISEDLDEVLALADRVQAIVAGRLSQEHEADALDARRLGLLMSAGPAEAA